MTSGFETPSSNPSLRIDSIRTDKCNSPLPETLNLSELAPGSTRKATLLKSSCSKRSLIFREVTNFPSKPAKGESLTWKVILTVGSSTDRAGIASTFNGSHKVSEINNFSTPVIQTISPASASGTSTLSKPS